MRRRQGDARFADIKSRRDTAVSRRPLRDGRRSLLTRPDSDGRRRAIYDFGSGYIVR